MPTVNRHLKVCVKCFSVARNATHRFVVSIFTRPSNCWILSHCLFGGNNRRKHFVILRKLRLWNYPECFYDLLDFLARTHTHTHARAHIYTQTNDFRPTNPSFCDKCRCKHISTGIRGMYRPLKNPAIYYNRCCYFLRISSWLLLPVISFHFQLCCMHTERHTYIHACTHTHTHC